MHLVGTRTSSKKACYVQVPTKCYPSLNLHCSCPPPQPYTLPSRPTTNLTNPSVTALDTSQGGQWFLSAFSGTASIGLSSEARTLILVVMWCCGVCQLASLDGKPGKAIRSEKTSCSRFSLESRGVMVADSAPEKRLPLCHTLPARTDTGREKGNPHSALCTDEPGSGGS
jgi:hypothetical protein